MKKIRIQTSLEKDIHERLLKCWDFRNKIRKMNKSEIVRFLIILGMQQVENAIQPRETSAPDWLIDRMNSLAALPRPTLKSVRAQIKASNKWRREWYSQDCYSGYKNKKVSHVK